MEFKYIAIKSFETIPIFLHRVKFEVGSFDLTIQNVSTVMGKGIQVLTLVSNTLQKTVKLEVYEDQMNELKSHFNSLVFNEKPQHKELNGLDNIEDLYK